MPRRRRSAPLAVAQPHPQQPALLWVDAATVKQDLIRLGLIVLGLVFLLTGIAYWQATSDIPQNVAAQLVAFLNL